MCSRILKQALCGFVVRSLGCLHGQETAEGAAIRIALPEGCGVTGEASAQAGPVAQGIAAEEGADSKHDGVKWFSHGFYPLRARCRNAGWRISSGDSRVLRMLAVNLVQDSASPVWRVMAQSRSSGRCSRRETGL